MSSHYGQFCPVAKAMELLDERWTLLIIRELMLGSQHFNALRRGVPRMSPALLSKRLQTLVRAGVVERWEDGNRVTYRLSESGKELEPIVVALGQWGIRWISELGDEDLDPHLLLWDMRRSMALDAVPPGRVVIRFRFRDLAADADWWLVVADGEVDVCDYDPGYDVVGRLSTSLRVLTEVWRGDRSWPSALRAGDVVVHASSDVERQIPGWLGQSSIAQAVAGVR